MSFNLMWHDRALVTARPFLHHYLFIVFNGVYEHIIQIYFKKYSYLDLRWQLVHSQDINLYSWEVYIKEWLQSKADSIHLEKGASYPKNIF